MIRGPPRSTRTDTLFPYRTLVGFEVEAAVERVVGHVIGDPGERAPHPHLDPGRGDMIAKHRRAVRPREDRLGHVAPDLAPVDVPRRDNLDVPGPITAQIPMQKPDRLIRPAVRIMRHALHQRTRAVADPDDRYLDAHAVADRKSTRLHS